MPGPPGQSPRALPVRQTTLEEQADLSGMREEVVSLVVSTMAEGEEYRAGFEEQAQLWLEDPEEFLQRFLTLGNGPEELEPQPEEPPAHGTPSLQLFQQEVRGRSWCPREHRVPREVVLGAREVLGARGGGAGCPGGAGHGL